MNTWCAKSLLVIFCAIPFYSFPQGKADKTATHSATENMVPEIFSKDDLFKFSLACQVKDLLGDRSANSSYHPVLLSYSDHDSVVNIPLKAKTRGRFRKDRSNCFLPPLLLNFSNTKEGNKIFGHQDKMKMVVACRDDELVGREYLVYKMYNLVTPKSFRVRMGEATFIDSANQKNNAEHLCFLIEDEDQMAKRNFGVIWEDRVQMEATSSLEFTRMALFEYLIANTDWSVTYQQNIKLLYVAPNPVYAVPYDFDYAGIVNAPYAVPAEELGITSVRQRLYRGYCSNLPDDFTQAVQFFNKIKPDIINLYQTSPYITDKYRRYALKFIEDFYEDINNSKALDKVFNQPCRVKTRVEIKGLKN